MRNRFFSSTLTSFFFGKAPDTNAQRVYPKQRVYSFRTFDPTQLQSPDQFREYQDEISRLLRVVLKEMTTLHMSRTLRTTLAHYHPADVHHPPHSLDIIKSVREYGSVVFYTLSLAKEGLDIMSGENLGNPPAPYALNKQHFDAIISIPALRHLIEHPAMKACAQQIIAKGEDIDFPAREPYEKYAPTRLLRDW